MEMNMIKPLDQTPKETIFRAFKEAFTNYVIPLDMTPELHFRRWEAAGVDFSQSYGAFVEKELVAFVLHIPLTDALYNFGTGVIPQERGKRWVGKIYEEILRRHPHVPRFLLEVIRGNDKAHKLYQTLGFQTVRELHSLDGFLALPETSPPEFRHEVKPLYYTGEMENIRMMKPAVESSQEVLMRKKELHQLHEVRLQDKLLAYTVYTPYNSSLREMGSSDENALDFLLKKIELDNKKVRVMNIESEAQGLITYLEARNLKKFVSQYEMEKLSVPAGKGR